MVGVVAQLELASFPLILRSFKIYIVSIFSPFPNDDGMQRYFNPILSPYIILQFPSSLDQQHVDWKT